MSRIPRRNRRHMEAESVYEMHIIKYFDSDNPSVHSFPVEAETLADITKRCSLRHLRTLTPEQLTFMSAHLAALNAKIQEQCKEKEQDREATLPNPPGIDQSTLAYTPANPAPSNQFIPLPFANTSEVREEDFETLWVLEGIDIEVEPDTIFRIARQGVRSYGEVERKAMMGVKTWKPVPGVQRDVIAVYSRQVCVWNAGRRYRETYSRQWRDIEDEEVWKVEDGKREVRRQPRTIYSDSEDEVVVDRLPARLQRDYA